MDPSENKNTGAPNNSPLEPIQPDIQVNPPQAPTPETQPANPKPPANSPSFDLKAAPDSPATPPVATPENPSIFDQSKEAVPKKEGIAENIIKLSDEKKKNKTLLGDVPELDDSIIDRTYIQKRKLNILYSVFAVILIAFGLSYGFFYSQLNKDFTWFGTNIAQNVQTSNQEITRLQTDINEQNYLIGQMILSEFAVNANKFQDLNNQIKSTKTTDAQKQSAQSQLPQVQTQLVSVLQKLKKVFTKPIAAPTFNSETNSIDIDPTQFISPTKIQLSKNAQRFASNPEQFDEYRLYNNAAKIVGNTELNNAIINSNISQNDFSADQIKEILTAITSNAKNEFSIINSLKSQRVNWNEILTNIINSTKLAEEGLIVANEGTTQMRFYESGTTRAILYSSYTIDAVTGRITVSGTLRTPDEKTFSTMANLIESFESSPNFRDINYRSFAKSGSQETGYESNFQIEFFIENPTNA